MAHSVKLWSLFVVDEPGGGRLHAMEGLRGIAVTLVFFVHFTTLVEPWLPAGSLTLRTAEGLRGVGNTGVDLFFVLSGYLIYGHLIVRRRDLWDYFRRRAERIYPTFLAVLAIYLLAAALGPASGKWPSGLLPAALYLAGNIMLLPGLFPADPIITVSWSLSYEAAYYVATPLAIILLRLRNWPPAWRVLFLAAVALLGTLWQRLHGGDLRWIMFLSGALLFETKSRPSGPLLDQAAPFLLLATLAATWVLRGLEGTGPLRVWVLFTGFYLVCLAAFTGRGPLTRLASWLPLRMFGNMSYSYYLIHGLTLTLVVVLFRRLLPPDGHQPLLLWLGVVPAFALTIAPAALLFLAVERSLSIAPSRSAQGASPLPAPIVPMSDIPRP